MDRALSVIAVLLTACTSFSNAESASPQTDAGPPDDPSTCGGPLEAGVPVQGFASVELLGSCQRAVACIETRQDTDTIPPTPADSTRSVLSAECVDAGGGWSTSACDTNGSIGGCRQELASVRCTTYVTTWFSQLADPAEVDGGGCDGGVIVAP